MSVSISAKDLAQIARTPDRELRVEQQDGQNVIASNEGSFGGRLARSLKIATDWGGRATDRTKQTQYDDAANAVFKSLANTYGKDIALTAFKAGIGHETNGKWDHSWNRPITGRHIQKMLSAAEKELKANNEFRVTEGPWDAFRDRSGDTVTRGPSLMWYHQSATLGSSPDKEFWQTPDVRGTLQHLQDHGQSGVPGFEERGFAIRPPLPELQGEYRHKRGLGIGDAIGRQLLQDADARPAANDQPDSTQDFWQLQVRRTGSQHASIIGIRIDRDQPDTVHVFDPNRGEFAVPRNRLAGFLGQHLKDVYGDISAHTLSRVDQVSLHGEFETYDGQPIDYTITASKLDQARKEEFDHLANRDALVDNGPDTAPLSTQFRKDIDRIHMTVQSEIDGNIVQKKITRQNCDAELGRLLPDNLDEDARDRALGNLSRLVGQKPFVAMQIAFDGSLRTSELTAIQPQVLPSARNIELRPCMLEDYRPGIEIAYDVKSPMHGYTEAGDLHALTPDRDFIQSTMTLRVAIEDLLKEPDIGDDQPFVPEFEISGEPTRRYHIERPPQSHVRELSFRTGTDGEQTARLNDLIPAYRMQGLRDRIGERVKDYRELTLDNDQTVSDVVFRGLNEGPIRLAIGHGDPRLLRISDSITGRLGELNLTDTEMLEVSKLLDRGIVDDAVCETARSLGMTADQLSEFMNKQRAMDIRIDRLPDGALAVSLSTDVTSWRQYGTVEGNLHGLQEDDMGKLRLSLTLRVGVTEEGKVERGLIGAQLCKPTVYSGSEGIPGYEFYDGVMHKTVEFDEAEKTTFTQEIQRDLSLAGNDDLHLRGDFTGDMGRMMLTVEIDGERTLLESKPGNDVNKTQGEEALRQFVGGDGIERDRAVARLSQLLNMSSAAAGIEPLRKHISADAGFIVPGMDSGRIHLRMDGDMVEINYATDSPGSRLGGLDGRIYQSTSPSTDYLRTSCQIRIPLDQLRGAEEPTFEVTQWPEASLHVEGYEGVLRARGEYDLSARSRDVRVERRGDVRSIDIEKLSGDQAKRLEAMRKDTTNQELVTVGDARIAECALEFLKGVQVGPKYAEEMKVQVKSRDHGMSVLGELADSVGSDQQQVEQLSKLMNARVIDEAHSNTLLTLGATIEEIEDRGSKGETSVFVAPSEDNEWLHVTFSKQADGLFDCPSVQPLLDRNRISAEQHRLDVMVEIRVRREDLINGHPERFEFVHGGRLEIEAREMQLQ